MSCLLCAAEDLQSREDVIIDTSSVGQINSKLYPTLVKIWKRIQKKPVDLTFDDLNGCNFCVSCVDRVQMCAHILDQLQALTRKLHQMIEEIKEGLIRCGTVYKTHMELQQVEGDWLQKFNSTKQCRWRLVADLTSEENIAVPAPHEHIFVTSGIPDVRGRTDRPEDHEHDTSYFDHEDDDQKNNDVLETAGNCCEIGTFKAVKDTSGNPVSSDDLAGCSTKHPDLDIPPSTCDANNTKTLVILVERLPQGVIDSWTKRKVKRRGRPPRRTATGNRTTISSHQKAKEKIPFICGFCGEAFKDCDLYKDHRTQHAQEELLPGHLQPEAEGAIETVSCTGCERQFSSVFFLDVHLRRDHRGEEEPYLCRMCGKRFKTISIYYDHRRKPPCKQRLPRSWKRVVDASHYLKCDECDYLYNPANKSMYGRHKEKHHKAPPYHPFCCDKCPRKFRTNTHLSFHVRKVHDGNPAPYTCDQCGKGYQRTTSFRIHRVLVHGIGGRGMKDDLTQNSEDLKFECVCETCGRVFKHPTHLASHKKLHGEKRHKCDHPGCDKAYARKQDLEQHQTAHSDERPLVCEKCGKGFKKCAKTYFRLHRSKCSGDFVALRKRISTCSLCGAKFHSLDARSEHQRLVHRAEVNNRKDESQEKESAGESNKGAARIEKVNERDGE